MAESNHEPEPQNFAPKDPPKLDPPKDDPITHARLAQCNGICPLSPFILIQTAELKANDPYMVQGRRRRNPHT